MPGCRRLCSNSQGRPPPRRTGDRPRSGFANAFETFFLEEPGQKPRLAGHRRAIVWICEEHALLGGETLRQDSDVRNCSRRCSDPGRVNQRKRQHLGEDRRIIRMPDVAKWSGSHYAEARRVHHLNVPMLPQRADDPPAQRICCKKHKEHRHSQRRNEGTLQGDDFDGGARKHRGVQQNHPAEFRFVDLRRAARDHLLLVATGDAQLHEPQQSHGEEQREKRDHTQVHCSSRNSALKPGPKAAATAYSPGLSGLFSSHSCRIKRIVALERFPTLPRISQEGCVSHFVRPNCVSTLPSRRAPPGCRIHPLISSRFRPFRSRKPETSPPIFAPIISGTSLASIMWKPESFRSNPMAPRESGNV